MSRRFVMEAVMLAIYGQLLVPNRPVEYLIPYSTLLELYELRQSGEPVVPDSDEDEHVKRKISELISFFEDSFNKKKIERALSAPWRKSAPLPIGERVSLTIVYAVENAEFGEGFDPIETDMLLIAMKEQEPLLTDQLELVDRIIEAEIPVQAFDVEDFEFAVEDEFYL